MRDESASPRGQAADALSAPGLPTAVDRATFQAELDRLRAREKAQPSLGALLADRQIGLFHLVCYLRDGPALLRPDRHRPPHTKSRPA